MQFQPTNPKRILQVLQWAGPEPVEHEQSQSCCVVADEAAAKHHQLRVIDESGEDYLYPEEYFVPVQLPQAAREGRAARS